MRPLLGTFVEIGIEGVANDVETAMERAFGTIEQVQRLLSFHDPRSELSRLNGSAGRFVSLSSPTLRVLRAGRALSIASGGLFNYTVGGAMVRLGMLPDHGGGPALDNGSAADVEIRGGEARLVRPVRITLDGIAKGYAVDRAVSSLRRHGAKAGWINAGGDVRAFGAVTLPIFRREADGSMRALGGLREASVATSVVSATNDDREHRGSFPGCIVDADGEMAVPGAWTVLAHHAWKADALTKVAALARSSGRAELIRRLGGTLVEPQQVLH